MPWPHEEFVPRAGSVSHVEFVPHAEFDPHAESVPRTPVPQPGRLACQQFPFQPPQNQMNPYAQHFINLPANGQDGAGYGHRMDHGHPMGHHTGRSASVSLVRAQPLNDPFVDSRSAVQSPLPSTPVASRPRHQSMASVTTTPVTSRVMAPPVTLVAASPAPGTAEYKARAAYLAAQIRAGAFASPPGSKASPAHHRSRRSTAGASVGGNNEWAVQQPGGSIPPVPAMPPVVRQNFITPAVVPDPPFFAALSHGFRPTAEDAFDYIPLVEIYAQAGPCNNGVIKIGNVSDEAEMPQHDSG